jgi:ADP-ribose pyrophosphatase YjhB (NUDIX family)
LGYRDEPDRDPRAHAVSHAFKAEILSWEPKAADDAKSIVAINSSDIDDLEFAFPDHKEMILKALSLE